MRACITVIDGPAAGKKLWLLAGQRAEIGRNSSVDLAVTSDDALAEIHLLIECSAHECQFRDVSGGPGVKLNNDDEVADSVLADGDILQAGKTKFSISLPNTATEQISAPQPTEEEPKTKWPKVEAEKATEITTLFRLDQGKELIKDWYTPDQFFQVLLEKACFDDAIRLMSHALPKKEAIWWSHECNAIYLNDESTEPDQQAQAAVLTWLQEPSDENRRAAMKAAEHANCETPSALTALAVFFAEGSIAEPEFDPIPPGELITAQGIAGAVTLATVFNEELAYPANFLQSLQLGATVAEGKSTWPPAEDE